MSFEPNVRIAKLLSHSGVASIAVLPTAITGDDVPPTIPAAICEAPMAAAPDSTPSTAPASR